MLNRKQNAMSIIHYNERQKDIVHEIQEDVSTEQQEHEHVIIIIFVLLSLHTILQLFYSYLSLSEPQIVESESTNTHS